MKQIRVVCLFILVLMLFSACSNAEQTDITSPSNSETISGQKDHISENSNSELAKNEKILIAYFSWAENAVQDDIDAMTSPSVSAPGNVAQLASWISSETGGDLFSVQVTDPYPADWEGCLNRANNEKADGIHPALSETLDNMEEYDTVFLGYPNWWYSCPMAIYSFLDEHDLNEKQIYLFCSHGTGGLASSVKDITAALPSNITVSDNVFHVYQNDTPSAQNDVLNWLKKLGY